MPRLDSETTVVGQGMRVRGDLTGDGDLVVHGNVEGTITLGGGLRISATGRVDAEVIASRVHVAGVLEGRVQATQQVAIAKTGTLTGLVRGLLTVEEGGVFQGRLEVDTPAERASTTPGSAAPDASETPSSSSSPSLRLEAPARTPRRLTSPSGGHPAVPSPGHQRALQVLDEPPPAAPTTARMKAISETDVKTAERIRSASSPSGSGLGSATPSGSRLSGPTPSGSRLSSPTPSMPPRPTPPTRRAPTAETPALRPPPLRPGTPPRAPAPPVPAPPKLASSPQAELEDSWFEEADFLVKKADGPSEPAAGSKKKRRPPKKRR